MTPPHTHTHTLFSIQSNGKCSGVLDEMEHYELTTYSRKGLKIYIFCSHMFHYTIKMRKGHKPIWNSPYLDRLVGIEVSYHLSNQVLIFIVFLISLMVCNTNKILIHNLNCVFWTLILTCQVWFYFMIIKIETI